MHRLSPLPPENHLQPLHIHPFIHDPSQLSPHESRDGLEVLGGHVRDVEGHFVDRVTGGRVEVERGAEGRGDLDKGFVEGGDGRVG